jgi:hypothetical protein
MAEVEQARPSLFNSIHKIKTVELKAYYEYTGFINSVFADFLPSVTFTVIYCSYELFGDFSG